MLLDSSKPSINSPNTAKPIFILAIEFFHSPRLPLVETDLNDDQVVLSINVETHG
jgi:hypothetical protein